MEEIKTVLKNLIDAAPSKNKIFKRNILKEYLQILVLDYIYSHKDYSRLIFYGGSCLAHCHNLPRLSEDLDFVDAKNEISIARLADDLEKYFNEKTDIKAKAAGQKFRVYLKFPILRELGLSEAGESDFLFLKVEVFQDFSFCRDFKTEIIPLFKLNRSISVRAFDLPTLMGYDSDHPVSLGEAGKCGVAIDSLKDMERLFSGIPPIIFLPVENPFGNSQNYIF